MILHALGKVYKSVSNYLLLLCNIFIWLKYQIRRKTEGFRECYFYLFYVQQQMTCLLPVVYNLAATIFKIYLFSESILVICNLYCLMFDIVLDEVLHQKICIFAIIVAKCMQLLSKISCILLYITLWTKQFSFNKPYSFKYISISNSASLN